MRTPLVTLTAAALALTLAACSQDDSSPTEPAAVSPAATRVDAGDDGGELDHLVPRFNLDVVLRGQGRGLLRFRQPIDGVKIVDLNIQVRGLTANTSYLLQRAVDPVVDDACTSTDWLTLGQGLTPQAITTGGRGRAFEKLFRDLTAVPDGTPFDIHFRVIDAATSAVVLESGCYQFKVRAQ